MLTFDDSPVTVAVLAPANRHKAILARLADISAIDLTAIRVVFIEDEHEHDPQGDIPLARTAHDLANLALDAQVNRTLARHHKAAQAALEEIGDTMIRFDGEIFDLVNLSVRNLIQASFEAEAHIERLSGLRITARSDAKDKRPGHLRGEGAHITSMRRR